VRYRSHPASVALLAVTGVIAIGLGVRPAAEPRQATFRTGVQTVAIYATVRDAGGRLVPDLDRSAFRVLDNGRPVELSVFSNEPQPFTAAILLDMSDSLEERVLLVRESTMRFIDALSDRDRARIVTFGDEVAISPILTGDKALLKRVLAEELWPGGYTPLWRALMAAMTSLDGEQGRRVLLVLSDGADTDSGPRLAKSDDVKRRVVRDAFMVYAIGIEGPEYTNVLAGAAEETGGGHFKLKSDADLGDTFSHVAEELRHQYLLGFSPTVLDGQVHKLDVQVVRTMLGMEVVRNDLSVRAARSYVARVDK
jgi:Ca-activated chloride channel homolog